MANRRTFIKNLSAMGFVAPVAAFSFFDMNAQQTVGFTPLDELQNPTDDDFWKAVQSNFEQSAHFINLENGYFSPQPSPVLNAFMENTRTINQNTSLYMRTKQFDDKEMVRNELAAFAQVDAEELALTRNTTESLNIIIQGLPLKTGEEAILAHQDYGSMVEAFGQRARRDGIVLKKINLPLHPKTDEEIVQLYKDAITPKTKIILVTHMINTTGQILPLKKICAMAHANGVEVMVDGAHTFAHIDFKITDLGCDYFAASLHKWLCCPIGGGLLWVHRKKIKTLWPLFGDDSQPHDNIRKLEHQGTHPCAVQLSIPSAIKFHNLIGSQNKEARLRYLKNYWVGKLTGVEGISFNTPADDRRTCAIANIAVAGISPSKLAAKLYDEHKIFTVAIESETIKGVRVTPHLYTTEAHLDKLVEALTQIAQAKK